MGTGKKRMDDKRIVEVCTGTSSAYELICNRKETRFCPSVVYGNCRQSALTFDKVCRLFRIPPPPPGLRNSILPCAIQSCPAQFNCCSFMGYIYKGG